LARGRTSGSVEEFSFPDPADYKLGKRSFYTLVLELGKASGTRTELEPFVFGLAF
jgi:hypothetical protein